MAIHNYTIKGRIRKEESRTLCPQVEAIEEGDIVIIHIGKKKYYSVATICESVNQCASCLLCGICSSNEFCPVDEDGKYLCDSPNDRLKFLPVDNIVEDI